jgi:ABC-type glycerol-3-phosphate transport system substrate-binding protein
MVMSNAKVALAEEHSANTIDSLSEFTGYEYLKYKYSTYREEYQHKEHLQQEINIPAYQYSHIDGMEVEILEDFEGSAGKSILTEEQGNIEWDVDLPEEGLYNISIEYYPIKGKSSAIQRSLFINGKLPFGEAANLEFNRVWGNALDHIESDNRGNELRPRQIEKPMWQNAAIKDFQGYYREPFSFYFEAGKNTISLYSQREPMVIKHIRLHPIDPVLEYNETVNRYNEMGLKAAKSQFIKIQAQDAVYKSEPTLYPFTDRSTYLVEPYHPSELRINAIGGYNWRVPGQTITWEIDVPETGLYNIGLKAKQRHVRGLNSNRKIYINGEVPFKEMQQVQFQFNTQYSMKVLGGHEPQLFHLNKGINTITLEVVLGDVAPLIRTMEAATLELTALYRKILMITGAKPDVYRDYQLETRIPDLLKDFQRFSDVIVEVATEYEKITGQKNEYTATLHTMAEQLQNLINRPQNISKSIDSMRNNISALGTFVLTVREQPLDVDYLIVASPDEEMPVVKESFFKRLINELVVFFYSFIIDYNTIGNIIENPEKTKSVEVWITTGRDQAQVIKSLVDDYFTPATGINVKLRLVQGGTLLPATLVGTGPDVALHLGNDIPVNYAMRNAVYDLTQFDDFEEVAQRFRQSALVPYQYDGGVYALPETQRFEMLFYRKDILEELGLEVPQTWEDIFAILSVLSKNHMEFGLPQPGRQFGQQAIINLQPNPMYAMLLYQLGGDFYQDAGTASGLTSVEGVKAFQMWNEFYTHYSLPAEFQFANRFRTGEMPIAIEDYQNYNLLQVFAPELRGLWGFAPVPGFLQEDGTIKRDVASTGENTILLDAAEDKDSAWEFMKWWTSEEIQTEFGREMEGLMGAAARWPTANVEAFEKLPWPVEDFKQLQLGFEWVKGIPEVPGGYFTGRHIENAFWKVRHEDYNPRESLEEYVELINSEIELKRFEFGLPNNQ